MTGPRSTIREAHAAWLVSHAAELQDGRKSRFVTSSGIPVKALYSPLDLDDSGWKYDADCGFPGEQPYTRGFAANGYRRKLWDIEMYAGFGSAEDANKRFRYLIDQGVTGGVSIALDLPTQIGLDSDNEMALDEIGQIGVALSSLADVERVFEGIPLDRVGHIFTTANCIAPIAVAWFLALAQKQGISLDALVVQIQNDPIKEYIARGTQFLPIEAAVKLATDTVEYVVEAAPNWLPISISGSHMKQAGANCIQEAAFTICNAITYVEDLLDRGMHIDDFGDRLELHFCTEMDFFEEVAKYRAVRKVWTRLVRERFGGTTAKAQRFRMHAATSGRPLTAQQPLNNISRITLQALAQVFGGCEQTRTASFDEALGIPTEQAATVSIRTNQIIAHETGIPDTVDPLGGSYFVENMTMEFEKRIIEIIDKVDAMGGALEGVRKGYFQQALADGAYREQQAVENGEQVVVGVNKFQSDDAQPFPAFAVDEAASARQIDRLRDLRERRDAVAVTKALDQLRDDCDAGRNIMPSVLVCVKAYATLGEICDIWRQAFGEYQLESVRL